MMQLKDMHIQKEIVDLKRQVKWLSSLLISVAGQDDEGSYTPAFVRTIKKASEETADMTFSSPTTFLTELREV
jgi:hypothetical protein